MLVPGEFESCFCKTIRIIIKMKEPFTWKKFVCKGLTVCFSELINEALELSSSFYD